MTAKMIAHRRGTSNKTRPSRIVAATMGDVGSVWAPSEVFGERQAQDR
jgi:hypothetical protein